MPNTLTVKHITEIDIRTSSEDMPKLSQEAINELIRIGIIDMYNSSEDNKVHIIIKIVEEVN